MASANPASPSTPRTSPKPKGRGKPRFESKSLILWFITADIVLSLVLHLAAGWSLTSLWWVHSAFMGASTFGLFGIDKGLARAGKRRVSEFNLLMLALLGGAVGGLLGMLTFRHKTRTPLFRFGVPVLLLLQLVLTAVIFTPSSS